MLLLLFRPCDWSEAILYDMEKPPSLGSHLALFVQNGGSLLKSNLDFSLNRENPCVHRSHLYQTCRPRVKGKSLRGPHQMNRCGPRIKANPRLLYRLRGRSGLIQSDIVNVYRPRATGCGQAAFVTQADRDSFDVRQVDSLIGESL